ncbi:MAG: hypothetical protein FJZ01_25955 [Candidatus Sericytochromatia bacterium]|nr:hypothetical protein [Candidatus Tanganyikabacteria bacterium]
MKKIMVAVLSTVVLAGCGAQTAFAPTATQATSLEAHRSLITLRQLTINSIVKFRDGGTIEVRGYVNRSTYATIRLDRGLSSPTRGQLLIKWERFGQNDDGAKFAALDKSQHGFLADALKSNLSRPGSNLDARLVNELLGALERGPGSQDDPDEPAAVDFRNLAVQSASRLRDGGSLVVKGYVNRGTYVTVKHDMGMSSPTRGKVLLTVEMFGSNDQPEPKVLGQAHWNGLREALESNAKRAGSGLDVSILRDFAERLTWE